MRRSLVIIAITLLLLSGFLMNVNADHEWDHRYTINGKVFEVDGNKATGIKAIVDCSEGATDPSLCEHNSGRNAKSSLSGSFELMLHVHSSQHGKILVLEIDGQRFNHTIDLTGDDGQADAEDRFVSPQFTLDHEVSKTGTYIAIALLSISIAIPLLYFLNKRKTTTFVQQAGRSNLPSKALSEDVMTNCPKCDVAVKDSNLESHLTKVHHQSKLKAKELADVVREDAVTED